MLELAKKSKIDLEEEIRYLSVWLKDCETYTSQFHLGTLYTSNTYDKLKEIAKTLYLCPIDLSEIYMELKPRLETAEAIKLDLKRIVSDHELATQSKSNKRLKFSRVSHALQIYNKECKIPGVKDIDQMLARVQKSKDRL